MDSERGRPVAMRDLTVSARPLKARLVDTADASFVITSYSIHYTKLYEAFGSETEEAARTALKRRYRLLPYLYTLFREASVTGMPVMRPVFFADPTDLSLRREDRAFMLGPDLAVVPQWASEPALPKGDWREITLVGENTAEDTHQPILLQRA